MNGFAVFRRSVAESWRGLIGWSLGMLAVIGMYLPLYPSIGGNEQFTAIIDSLPPELVRTLNYDQITTGAGYTQGTVFGLIGFVLVVIASVGWGTAAVAGAEESGSLELTLAHGIGRGRLVLERAAAIAVRLLVLGVVVVAAVLLINGPAELGLDPADVVATTAALLGLGLLSATAALAGGALTGKRSIALAAGAGVAVFGYVLNALANQSDDLDGLRVASPFHWAYGENPLAEGVDWAGLALLYGVSALLLALAVVGLRRRDVGV